MADCFAIGLGMVTTDGPCNAAGPSMDDAVKVLELAIDDAENQASKSCPSGERCQGTAIPLGAPTCRTQAVGGKSICVCVVTVTLTGHCAKPGAAPAPAPKGKVIEGKDLREFFRKVAELPDRPDRPPGNCDMYREQKGHGFYYPVCAGGCPGGGDCHVVVEVTKEKVRAHCSCD